MGKNEFGPLFIAAKSKVGQKATKIWGKDGYSTSTKSDQLGNEKFRWVNKLYCPVQKKRLPNAQKRVGKALGDKFLTLPH